MTDEHKARLSIHWSKLVKNIQPKEVINVLQQQGVLTPRGADEIRQNAVIDSQNEHLLDMLHRKADSAFEYFRGALMDTGQDHVANLLNKQWSLAKLLGKRSSPSSAFEDFRGALVDDTGQGHQAKLQRKQSFPSS